MWVGVCVCACACGCFFSHHVLQLLSSRFNTQQKHVLHQHIYDEAFVKFRLEIGMFMI